MAKGKLIRPRPTVKCGSTSHQDVSHGCGVGLSGAEAIDAATSEAQMVAELAGQDWIARQICPVRCPGKSGFVGTPAGNRKLKLSKPKVVSRNLLTKPATGRRPGQANIPGLGKLVRVCVAISWEATVTCGQDRRESD